MASLSVAGTLPCAPIATPTGGRVRRDRDGDAGQVSAGPDREVDVVVVGAGPGGEVCAGRLGEAGLEVVLVERERVGGECSFWACMPSKALLRPAEVLAEARRVPGAREAVTGPLDVAAVLARRDEVIHDGDDSGMVPWLDARDVELVRGHGRIAGPRAVRVDDGPTLTARRAVVVATGSGPAMPPVPGLAEARPWTNREATTAREVPGHLAVIGGGVVAAEMSQAWASLGAAVTVLVRGDDLLQRDEPFVREEVAAGLRDLGVDVRRRTEARRVERGPDGRVHIDLGDEALWADELLVATGRVPHTADLGLDTVGITPGEYVEVDAHLRRPDLPWLYAIGDANGRSLLTHMAKHHARVAADTILGRAVPGVLPGRLAPHVVFTDPQVAAVGHTLASAQEAGLRVREVRVGTSANAGGSFYGRGARGTSQLVVDEDRGVVVGATFTGSEIAEWLQAATIAVVGEVPLERLAYAVPPFPTRNEVWLRLLEELGL